MLIIWVAVTSKMTIQAVIAYDPLLGGAVTKVITDLWRQGSKPLANKSTILLTRLVLQQQPLQ